MNAICSASAVRRRRRDLLHVITEVARAARRDLGGALRLNSCVCVACIVYVCVVMIMLFVYSF